MEMAKVFENGRSQAVWRDFMEGIEKFTDDIFEDGREQGAQEGSACSQFDD